MRRVEIKSGKLKRIKRKTYRNQLVPFTFYCFRDDIDRDRSSGSQGVSRINISLVDPLGRTVIVEDGQTRPRIYSVLPREPEEVNIDEWRSYWIEILGFFKAY